MLSDMMKNALGQMQQTFEKMRDALEGNEPLPGPLGELPEDLQQELREKMKQALDTLEQFLKGGTRGPEDEEESSREGEEPEKGVSPI